METIIVNENDMLSILLINNHEDVAIKIVEIKEE